MRADDRVERAVFERQVLDPGTTVFGPFSTTQESGIKGYERIFNFNVLNYKVDNGKITLVSPDFHDTSAVAKSSS